MAYAIPKIIKEPMRRAFELIGISRYSQLGKYELDKKLQAYLPPKGIFLEVGALDGLHESNTYYLERICGWSGILIEPVPHFYRECAAIRKKSLVFNCALVSNDYTQSTICMSFAGRETQVKGDVSNYAGEVYEFEAQARTLTSVLNEAGSPEIDFFSLDVEGYEIQVLEGLNMSLYRPRWLLVECLTKERNDQMTAYLTGREYRFVDQVTPRDFLWHTN